MPHIGDAGGNLPSPETPRGHMSKLFEPTSVGNISVSNRIAMAR